MVYALCHAEDARPKCLESRHLAVRTSAVLPVSLYLDRDGQSILLRRGLLAISAPTTDAWQSLYNLYWVLAVAAGAITIGALVFFVTKYRARPSSGTAQHDEDGKVPVRTVLVIIIIMASVLAGAGYASFHAIGVYNNPPNGWNDPNALHVNVTGQRFSWGFNCTSGCGVPAVLTVPHNKIVILNITSIDVFHSFGIPDLRVKADAIPGKYNLIWFQVSTTGTFPILCYELCGAGHAFMRAKLVVT